MLDVDDYLKVRYAVQIEGLSHREAARRYGIDPKTVAKMMRFSIPPGYRRTKPPVKPKLDQDNAEKNCISNVRPIGIKPAEAGALTAAILKTGFEKGVGGVALGIGFGRQ